MSGNLVPSNRSPISLYFHIPFCTKKCDYCHFYVLPDKAAFHDQLFQGLRQEWKLWAPLLHQHEIETIYFGGGTPALFDPSRLQEILDWVQKDTAWNSKTPEISLEANPENMTPSLMNRFAQAGVNRLSIGIQSLDDALLQHLGRTHSAKKAVEAVYLAQEAGFSNLSVDLMYDLPGQTLAHWEETLAQIVQLPITHLSLYNLTLEPHTVFFKQRKHIQKQQPDPQTSLQMYQSAQTFLEGVGLGQYEISAFAKTGFHSRHNSGYWLARPFIGLGPSAFSYWQGRRFRSIPHLNRYCKSLEEGRWPHDFDEMLTGDAHLQELLTLQLRMLQGVHLDQFEEKHGQLNKMTYDVLTQLCQQGLIHFKDRHIQLTLQGILFYDTLAVELI